MLMRPSLALDAIGCEGDEEVLHSCTHGGHEELALGLGTPGVRVRVRAFGHQYTEFALPVFSDAEM